MRHDQLISHKLVGGWQSLTLISTREQDIGCVFFVKINHIRWVICRRLHSSFYILMINCKRSAGDREFVSHWLPTLGGYVKPFLAYVRNSLDFNQTIPAKLVPVVLIRIVEWKSEKYQWKKALSFGLSFSLRVPREVISNQWAYGKNSWLK